jgi:hypothetical protein
VIEGLHVDRALDGGRPERGADGRAVLEPDEPERAQRVHRLGHRDAEAVLSEQRAERDDLVVHRPPPSRP